MHCRLWNVRYPEAVKRALQQAKARGIGDALPNRHELAFKERAIDGDIVFQKTTAEARTACWAYDAHVDGWYTGSVDIGSNAMVGDGDPEGAIGKRVRRSETNGTVVGYVLDEDEDEDQDEEGDGDSSNRQLWKVHFDDYDEEDLNLVELQQSLADYEQWQQTEGAATTCLRSRGRGSKAVAAPCTTIRPTKTEQHDSSSDEEEEEREEEEENQTQMVKEKERPDDGGKAGSPPSLALVHGLRQEVALLHAQLQQVQEQHARDIAALWAAVRGGNSQPSPPQTVVGGDIVEVGQSAIMAPRRTKSKPPAGLQ